MEISRITLNNLLRPRSLNSSYSNIQHFLLELAGKRQFSTIGLFLPEASNLLWLIALGALATTAAEAISHIYSLLFAVGFFSVQNFGKRDKRVWYLFILSIATTLTLYNEMLSHWVVEYRYFGVVIIPAAVFAGYGAKKICAYTHANFNIAEHKTLSTIVAIILIFGVAKNCQPRYLDKLVFKKIGQVIAQTEKSSELIHIAGASYMAVRWVSFYANPNSTQIIYPSEIKKLNRSQLKNSAMLAKNLSESNIDYFITEEKYMNDTKSVIATDMTNFFEKKGVWYHKDTGKITLYKIRSSPLKND